MLRWYVTNAAALSGSALSDLAITTTAINATDQTVYTFEDMNMGSTHPNRLTPVVLVFRAATAVTISSITLGGIAVAIDVQARNTSNGLSSAVIGHVLTGLGTVLENEEQADLVVTLSATGVRAAISLLRTTLYDGEAPTKIGSDTRTNTPGTMSPNLTAADKGFAVGCAYSAGGASQRISVGSANIAAGNHTLTVNCQSGTSDWTVGLTDLIDSNIETSVTGTMAAASAGWKYP